MSYDWVNDYIGVPYVNGGRTSEGWDCYGVIMAAFKDQLGIDLPDFLSGNGSAIDAARKVTEGTQEAVESKVAEYVDQPSDWCVVSIHRRAAALHVGLCIAGGVLHSVQGRGTVFDSMAAFKRSSPGEVRFMKWQG